MATSTLHPKKRPRQRFPAKVRSHLKLRPGDKIEFVIERDGKGRAYPEKISTFAKLRGMLGPARRHLTIEQMDEAIQKQIWAAIRATVKGIDTKHIGPLPYPG